MALYPLRLNGSVLSVAGRAEPVKFSELPLTQDQVEGFFRTNLAKLLGPEENFMILGEEAPNNKQGHFDLVAIDAAGRLVQILVKSEIDPGALSESLETHVIQAVATLAEIQTPKELAAKLGGKNPEAIFEDLNQFMIQNKVGENFNRAQKIILVAPSYEARSQKSLQWLASNGVDLTCYQLTAMKIGTSMALDFTKVLPEHKVRSALPTLAAVKASVVVEPVAPVASAVLPPQSVSPKPIIKPEHFATFKAQAMEPEASPDADTVVSVPRKPFREPPMLPNMQRLMEWGVLGAGDKLTIRDFTDSDAVVVDQKFVMFKGEVLTFDQWGQKVTSLPSINIYDWAFHQKKKDTLFNLRSQKMMELENIRSN